MTNKESPMQKKRDQSNSSGGERVPATEEKRSYEKPKITKNENLKKITLLSFDPPST